MYGSLNPNTEEANDAPEVKNIFVYGTLTSEGTLCYNMLKHGAVLRGPFFTLPRFIMFGEYVPQAYTHEEGYNVLGECWTLPVGMRERNELIATLDRIEGHPHLYRRTMIMVSPVDKSSACLAFMYIGPKAGLIQRERQKPLIPIKFNDGYYHIWNKGIVGVNKVATITRDAGALDTEEAF